MTVKKKVYRYDIVDLEQKSSDAYFSFRKCDTPETRTQVFKSIYDLTIAILNVGGWHKYGIDFEDTAYEYSLQLFTGIVIDRRVFTSKKGKVAFNPYIKINLKDIIITRKNKKNNENEKFLLYEAEFLLESKTRQLDLDDACVDPCDLLERESCVKEIFDSLRVFYTQIEIDRMLGIALDIINNNKFQPLPRHLTIPADLRDFCVVLICVSKKLALQNNLIDYNILPKSGVDKALLSCVRSSVFLAMISNLNVFSKELMFASDIDTLYRLSSVAGGKRLKIPSISELDTLIGSCVTVSKMIIENRSPSKALKENQEDIESVFGKKVSIHYYISKAVEIFDFFKTDKKSDSFVNVLLASVISVESFFTSLIDRKKINKDVKSEYVIVLDKYIKSLNIIRDKLNNL